jgi:hypothetical protein
MVMKKYIDDNVYEYNMKRLLEKWKQNYQHYFKFKNKDNEMVWVETNDNKRYFGTYPTIEAALIETLKYHIAKNSWLIDEAFRYSYNSERINYKTAANDFMCDINETEIKDSFIEYDS